MYIDPFILQHYQIHLLILVILQIFKYLLHEKNQAFSLQSLQLFLPITLVRTLNIILNKMTRVAIIAFFPFLGESIQYIHRHPLLNGQSYFLFLICWEFLS